MPDVLLTPVGGDPWDGGAQDLHPSLASPLKMTLPEAPVEQNALSGDAFAYPTASDQGAALRSNASAVGQAMARIPVSAVQGAMEAVRAPRDAMEGRFDPKSDEGVSRALGMAGLMAGPGLGMAEDGAAGIFGGRLSATANRATADRAEQMLANGTERNDVLRNTGWFRGADGQMRTEIPDAGATLRPGALDAIRTGARYLPDVLDHPDLYAAYPGLKNMAVTGEALPGSDPTTMAGAFYSNRGRPDTHAMLYLAPESDLAEVRNTILHETQHAVQGIEGFNAGASPTGLKAALPSTKALKDTKLMSALLQSGVSPEDAASVFTERMGQQPHSAALDLAQRFSPEEIAKLPLGPNDAYHRNIGEVEARNVEARSTMTPAELAATAPWDTQSVPTAMQRPETGGVAWQFDSPDALDRHKAITDAVDGLVASGWTPTFGPQGSIRSQPPEIAGFASPQSQGVIRDRLAFHGIVPPGTRNLSLYGVGLPVPTSSPPVAPEAFERLLREGKAT